VTSYTVTRRAPPLVPSIACASAGSEQLELEVALSPPEVPRTKCPRLSGPRLISVTTGSELSPVSSVFSWQADPSDFRNPRHPRSAEKLPLAA